MYFSKLFYKIHECIYLIKIHYLVILIFWLFKMIDNSISYPTKQIWINFELYFESYEFYNFYEFSRTFLNLINSIFYFKIIKKNKKRDLFTARWCGRAKPRGDAWTCVRVTRGHVCVMCVRDVYVWHTCVCVTHVRVINKWVEASAIGFKLTC